MCIRDRYQRRVRGYPTDMHLSTTTALASILIALSAGLTEAAPVPIPTACPPPSSTHKSGAWVAPKPWAKMMEQFTPSANVSMEMVDLDTATLVECSYRSWDYNANASSSLYLTYTAPSKLTVAPDPDQKSHWATGSHVAWLCQPNDDPAYCQWQFEQ
eukprot:TRINITY_DN15567_c0_g1_i4.p2 TRINITY_DN15567_c0_g1~~TRINITY_DN15567_c0_g1_i4.p2  ORF type:complete len:170 (-),score=39.68 TRINITY_DN15567_c0_g1_i4:428-901(-)